MACKTLVYYMTLIIHIMLRKKTVDEEHLQDTKLSRCLNTLDLTALGVGSTLGAGVYVIAGEVAQKTTGPAVIISFLIAASASVLAGLCYAEFGARVPKSGSAYVYSYVTVGELMAFVIGWNLILEYVIGTASVARAWSQNFDKLIGGHILDAFSAHMTMDVPGIAEYPDFFAFGITILLTIIISVGVKESAWVTKIFTLVNLLVLSTVVIGGLWLVDVANWQVVPQPNGTTVGNKTFAPELVGAGGFMPFGVRSIISGAGTCFYAFVGFDAIATTGEEVKNPQRAIPISIILSLSICFVAYFSLSSVLTLILPYFALDPKAPLPSAFAAKGWTVANYVIAVGAVCALSTSLLGAMFPLPRIMYSMASDGLIFRFLSRVNQRVSTPLIATLVTGTMAGIMACVFELKELVDMMSIGTLLAYTLVAMSVLILRGNQEGFHHHGEESNGLELKVTEKHTATGEEADEVLIKDPKGKEALQFAEEMRQMREMTLKEYARLSFFPEAEEPTRFSECVNRRNTFLFFVAATALAFVTETFSEQLLLPQVALPALLALLLCVALGVSLYRQPEAKKKIPFKVPCVPLIPCVSIFANIYLMMALPNETWIRFLVWMAIGFSIYFLYGVVHSSEHELQTRKKMKGIKMAILLEGENEMEEQEQQEQQEQQQEEAAASAGGSNAEEV